MENNESHSSLSFFTSNHPRHDSSWIFRGASFKILCVACLVETLEDKEALAIRKRKCLTEILLLLSRDKKLVDTLTVNSRISSHLCQILVNLLESTQDGISQMSIEAIMQLLVGLQNEVLVREILNIIEDKVLSLNNFRKTYPFVVLLGKIIDAIPLVAEEIIVHKRKLWEYCISGMSFPDEKAVAALLYLVLGTFRNNKAKETISVEVKVTIFKSCCNHVINGINKDVKANSLAVLQSCIGLQDNEFIKLLSGEAKESKDIQEIIANALKKLVLSTDQGLQIGGIQLTTKLMSADCIERTLSASLLRNGLAEFLFEALETNNDIVLASLFCCLTELCKCAEFFKGSYSIYGIDSVVTAVAKAISLQNPETLQQGLHVLSTIISKQKKDVPLFSNGTIFGRCLMVSEECLKAMEYKVLEETLHLVRSLLRVDQLPSGYNVVGIISTLNGIVAVLNRFTSKTVDNFSSMQSGTAQDLLSDLLEVIYQVGTFSETYSSKSPSLEEALLGDLLPDSQTANRQSVSQALDLFVMKTMDESCIKAVMVNYEAISKASVFEVLFKLLNSQLTDSNQEKSKAFAVKLANASFIRVSMEVSGRFCKGGENIPLMKELQNFQRGLIINLNEGYYEDERVRDMFEFEGIPGSPDEYLSLLSQSSLDPVTLDVSDEMLFKIQCYCIEILYLSYIFQDFILDEKNMIRGIYKFICLNKKLCILPALTLKHILHLYTEITMKYQNEQQAGHLESQRIVQQELLKVKPEDFHVVSCHTASFVQWIFQSEPLARAFGYSFLKNILSKNEEFLKFTWKSLKNKHAVKYLASLLESEEAIIVQRVSQVFENILTEDGATEGNNDTVITELIAEDLHKLFLKHQEMSLPDHVLAAMLQVLLSLQIKMGEKIDIKIFHLVVDILTKPSHKCSDITIAVVNYINIVLWTTRATKSAFAAVLLSNEGFLVWLQKVMTVLGSMEFSRADSPTAINVFGACMILISNLVISQDKHSISNACNVSLDMEILLAHLNDYHNGISQLTNLIFWETLLDSKTKTFVVFDRQKEANNANGLLTETDCKLMLVYLQNALMHESKIIRNCAMGCLQAFLSSSERTNYCSSNPWNKVVIESLLFSLTHEKLDSELIQFCKIMMKAKRFWNMEEALASATALILREIPDVYLDDQGQIPAIALQCISFIRELVLDNLHLVRSSASTPLITWMKKAKEMVSQGNKSIKRLCFIKVDQLVLPGEIVLDKGEVSDARTILDILKVLERKCATRE